MAADSDAEDEVNRTLYCGFPSNDGKVTEELLYELFLQAGPLEKVNIAKSGSCAFICFKHSVSVKYAIDLFKTTTLFGFRLSLQPRTGSNLSRQSAVVCGSRELPPPPYNNSSSSGDSSRDNRQSSGMPYGHRRYEPYPAAGSTWDAQGRDSHGRGSGGSGNSYPRQHEYENDSFRGPMRYNGPQHGLDQLRGRHDYNNANDGRGHRSMSERDAVRDRPAYADTSRGCRSDSDSSYPSSQPHFSVENQGRGLLGPLPMDLVNGPFLRNGAQQFISFDSPPQEFYGTSTDPISLELRRQRMLSTQSQRMAMHRK